MRFGEVAWRSAEERSLFLEEATELLAALEEGALAEPTPVDAMFRAAHTLKGSGGLIGLDRWVERLHHLEEGLQAVREGARPFDPELRREVLGAVDALRAELAGDDPEAAPEAQAWTLRWDLAQPMVGVRAYQAWQAVRSLDPRARSEPDPGALATWQGEASRLWLDPGIPRGEVRRVLQRVEGLAGWEEPPEEGDAGGREGATPGAAGEGGPSPFVPPTTASGAAVGTAGPRPAPAAVPEAPAARDSTLRVAASTLERLLEGLGELLLDQAQLEHRGAGGADGPTRAILGHMRGLTLDLQDAVLRARMLPLDTLFRQYPRAVHELAQRLGKRIRLETHGGETELDRIVMDHLHEPILHLLRNACDHGIEPPDERLKAGKPETGTVRLSAFAAQGHVHVVVEDDGAGIPWERLREKAARMGWLSPEEAAEASRETLAELLFRPGVSTAEAVTEVSGRGVGLDAVRALLDAIHGTVAVDSAPGQGTAVHLELPMTMAIMTALLVEAGPWIVGLPILAVERIQEVDAGAWGSLLGQPALADRGAPLPIYSLARLLDPQVESRPRFLVRVQDGRTRAALAVDGVRGQQEVVVKPVPVLPSLAPWMTGVALLGDGRLALMLDIRRLVPGAAGEVAAPAPDSVLRAGSNQIELLVFRLANGQRYGINVYKTREVLPAQAVTPVPHDRPWILGFMRLRGKTVPVVSLHRALGLPGDGAEAPLFLITEFNQTVQAFPVDAVERMVRVGWEEVEPVPQHLQAPTPEGRRLTGLVHHPELGSIQLLDFEQVLAQVAPSGEGEGSAFGNLPLLRGKTVWLADDSGVARHQVEQALRPLGVSLRSFGDGESLWQALSAGAAPPDLFVVDVEMPRLDGYTLTQRLKGTPRWRGVPVLLHTSLSGHWHAERVQRVGADELLTKFDPDLLARTVARMLTGEAPADRGAAVAVGAAG